ncbi:uncharacterized protein LOC143888674 [Tasmannia lanceolata]|uniref:uncharacterized protein LOC143888672 n=1 Tax=Tasmannia lanceolata TaxID=3420 RepID=UPI00406399F7
MGNRGPAGIGGVLRNELREVFWAFAGPLGEEDAIEYEVQAVHHGLRLVSREGIDNVIVEGDSLNVIRWLRGPQKPPWRFDNLFDKMFDLVKPLSAAFNHARRSAGWSC